MGGALRFLRRPETSTARSIDWLASWSKSWIVWAVVISATTEGVVILGKHLWTNDASQAPGPDGSGLIGTFITIYALFLGAFGGLTGLVVKSSHDRLRRLALTFMVEAVVLDLFRISNSTEDLYRTTVGKLSYFELNDNMHDFKIYFLVNFGVSAFALVAAALPEGHGPYPPASRSHS